MGPAATEVRCAGRLLTIRPAGPEDVDGLLALYRGLDVDDRHRRFFTAAVPPRHTVEVWSRVAERGGVLLVAEPSDSPGEIVAEAGCDLLDNGDGEFALAVAPAWRGWLGPYLFDRLLDAAADAGMPNLEGDILVENGPMLAIARSRGIAYGERVDPGVVRVVVPTGGGTPTWPPRAGGHRVLVEAGGLGWRGEDDLRRAGYEVLTCPGPRSGQEERCPLLAGGSCPLVDGADAVVVAFSADRMPGSSLLAVHRSGRGARRCIETAPLGDVAGVVAAVGEEVGDVT